jgi:hypothetical protein
MGLPGFCSRQPWPEQDSSRNGMDGMKNEISDSVGRIGS